MEQRRTHTGYVGTRLKSLSHAFMRKSMETARQLGAEEMSMMHGRVTGFLYRNRGREVYQKDLEEHFSITRSSVTSLVQKMESKGYLTRQGVEGDARLKQLILTPQAVTACERIMEAMDRTEALAVEGLTEEQLDGFFAVCDVIQKNLTGKEGDHACHSDHCIPDQGV